MKAFITGATGFIGTHVVKMLANKGWNLVILIRKNSDISEFENLNNITYVLGDITDIKSLREGIPEDVDVVYHIAGSVAHLPHHLEHTRYAVNVLGSRNVVDVCLEKKVKKLIYTSTVLVFDFHQFKPLTEAATYNHWCKDPYINSKMQAELEINKGLGKGMDIIFLHPSAVFGSQDKATWSKMFLEVNRGLPFPFAPKGGGSVCFVKSVAKAHVEAFYKGRNGEHYILGGPDVTWLQVLQEISRLLEKNPPKYELPVWFFKIYGYLEYFVSTKILRRDPMLTPHTIDILSEYIYSDSSKAVRELNYSVSSLEEMLIDCLLWMKETKRL